MRCECSENVDGFQVSAECSDTWWSFWWGVLGTWLPAIAAYRYIGCVESDEEDETEAPDTMYS